MTEKSISHQENLRSPPTRSESKEISTSCGLEAPCHQQEGAFHIAESNKSTTKAQVSCDSDFETQEALRNFQAYLDILREWDEKQKRTEELRQIKAVRCD